MSNPPNPFEPFDFSDVKPEYANLHVVSHSNKELHIILGQHVPPNTKAKVVAHIILTERHAIELVNSLNSQIKMFIDRHKGESDDPPKRA